MKIKTDKLTGEALNWAVGVAGGLDIRVIMNRTVWVNDKATGEAPKATYYMPSTDWSIAGEIIAREFIRLIPWSRELDEPMHGVWMAGIYSDVIYDTYHSTNPLEAAMRCYVRHKLGEVVNVPNEVIAK